VAELDWSQVDWDQLMDNEAIPMLEGLGWTFVGDGPRTPAGAYSFQFESRGGWMLLVATNGRFYVTVSPDLDEDGDPVDVEVPVFVVMAGVLLVQRGFRPEVWELL
jgi:hypothetical protein